MCARIDSIVYCAVRNDRIIKLEFYEGNLNKKNKMYSAMNYYPNFFLGENYLNILEKILKMNIWLICVLDD